MPANWSKIGPDSLKIFVSIIINIISFEIDPLYSGQVHHLYMWFILHLLYILQTTKTPRSLLEGNQENLDIRDKKKEAIGEEIAGQASHQIVTQGDFLVKRLQPLENENAVVIQSC